MKIVFLIPGFEGKFYCQNCVRDKYLVKGFLNAGHDAVIAPVYMPGEFNNIINHKLPVFFSAINLYIREKFKFHRYLPGFIIKLLKSEKLLDYIAKKSDSTDPKGMEEMTLSVMEGDNGKHIEDLRILTDWLKNEIKPDIIHVSNLLLIGIADYLKKHINAKVFTTLQDEDTWIDKMDKVYSKKVWAVAREKASALNALISVSNYYKKTIMNKSGIPDELIKVAYPGIEITDFSYNKPETTKKVIGYLSRITENLGFSTLLDAFILLKKRYPEEKLLLRVTGGYSSDDKKYIQKVEKKIKTERLSDSIEWQPFAYQENINDFFKGLTVLSVPAYEAESFGLFQLQSTASGIPQILSDSGGYREISEITKGALFLKENNPLILADTIWGLVTDYQKLTSLSMTGYRNVIENFAVENYVNRLLKIYTES